MFILSLLFVQVAGVHLHVDVGHPDSDSMHDLHVEQAFSDHHVDDNDHIDVDVNETATNPHLKVDFHTAVSSIVLSLNLSAQPTHLQLLLADHNESQLIHWRPPLRAPPVQA